MTHSQAIRHFIGAIIDADLNLEDARRAINSIIPKEHHDHHSN